MENDDDSVSQYQDGMEFQQSADLIGAHLQENKLVFTRIAEKSSECDEGNQFYRTPELIGQSAEPEPITQYSPAGSTLMLDEDHAYKTCSEKSDYGRIVEGDTTDAFKEKRPWSQERAHEDVFRNLDPEIIQAEHDSIAAVDDNFTRHSSSCSSSSSQSLAKNKKKIKQRREQRWKIQLLTATKVKRAPTLLLP